MEEKYKKQFRFQFQEIAIDFDSVTMAIRISTCYPLSLTSLTTLYPLFLKKTFFELPA